MSWLLQRHLPLARAGWRDLDANHSRPNESPIRKPWRRTNSNRSVWLDNNILVIADYLETPMQPGGVSYEQMCFTPNWGAEFDLNIDGNIVQQQFWGCAISPSWSSVRFQDIFGLPIVAIMRDIASAVNRFQLIVFHDANTMEVLAGTGTFTGLMNRGWYRFKLLIDRDRLVRVYVNGNFWFQYWMPSQYASSRGARALNFINQTSANSWQANFYLFDQVSDFKTQSQWTVDFADNFNRADTSGTAGPNWTQFGSNAGISANSWASQGTADGSRMLTRLSGNNSGMQRVSAVLGGQWGVNNTADCSLVLRCNATGTDALVCNIYANALYISIMSGGPTNPTMADVTWTNEVTFVNGDTVDFAIIGNHCWVERNGVPILLADINGALPLTNQRRGLRVTRKSFTHSASWNSVSLLNAA